MWVSLNASTYALVGYEEYITICSSATKVVIFYICTKELL